MNFLKDLPPWAMEMLKQEEEKGKKGKKLAVKAGIRKKELRERQDEEAKTSNPDLIDGNLWKAEFSYYCKYGDGSTPKKDWVSYAWTMDEANEETYLRLQMNHIQDFDDPFNEGIDVSDEFFDINEYDEPLQGAIYPDGGAYVLNYKVSPIKPNSSMEYFYHNVKCDLMNCLTILKKAGFQIDQLSNEMSSSPLNNEQRDLIYHCLSTVIRNNTSRQEKINIINSALEEYANGTYASRFGTCKAADLNNDDDDDPYFDDEEDDDDDDDSDENDDDDDDDDDEDNDVDNDEDDNDDHVQKAVKLSH